MQDQEQAAEAAQERVDGTVAAASADAEHREAADTAVVGAAADSTRGSARDALVTAAEQARATLAASEGAVADDTVRQTLAAALAEADAALAADTASVATLRRVTSTTAAAQTATADAQAQWTQAQEQAAAAAARTPRPASTGGTTAAAAPPSCETTYTGPPFYTSPATEGGDGSNGKLPPSALAAISWDVDPRGTPYYLRTDAAAALERLNTAFRAQFGHDLGLDLTYRDFATQVAMREALGTVAATPGTSSHGTGLALDVPELPCEYGWGTPQRDWLVANGPSYGWVVPSWARQNGSNPEYWHFEYRG